LECIDKIDNPETPYKYDKDIPKKRIKDLFRPSVAIAKNIVN
jgi:hypothetical protein